MQWGRQPIKVIMVGESGVGKSALLRQWCYNNKFTESLPLSKVISVGYKEVMVDLLKVTMEIWDVSAKQISASDIGVTADIGVLVYDICCYKSFAELENWMDEVLARVQSPESFPFVLMGNKYDATNAQVVSDATALAWCKAFNKRVVSFCKVSACTGAGVEAAFMSIARYALRDGTPALKRARKVIRDDQQRIRLLQEEHAEESADIGLVYEGVDESEVAVAKATVARADQENMRKKRNKRGEGASSLHA